MRQAPAPRWEPARHVLGADLHNQRARIASQTALVVRVATEQSNTVFSVLISGDELDSLLAWLGHLLSIDWRRSYSQDAFSSDTGRGIQRKPERSGGRGRCVRLIPAGIATRRGEPGDDRRPPLGWPFRASTWTRRSP
jgi:hypothetical protein